MAIDTHIRLDFDKSVIDMVVFDIVGKQSGPTMLVTGGVDGDEYAGMEACHRLRKAYAGRNFSGRLIIIPVVNVPGFTNGTSINPIDGNYPKLVGLGHARGTSSERLMHWVVSTYARHADAWIDLHGGSLTEELVPFLWVYRTGVKKIDQRNTTLCAVSPLPTVLVEKAGWFAKAGLLARKGCWYVVVEAGQLGRRDAKSISHHVRVVQSIVGLLGMDPVKLKYQKFPVTPLSRVQYATAPFPSLWTPMVHAGDKVIKNQELGVLCGADGTIIQSLLSKERGVVLWNMISMSVKPGCILAAVGFRK
ncbi:MAG: succinylglutamate desuccinylase/aspartoacylase family protein [Patescibacteria group bacterium]